MQTWLWWHGKKISKNPLHEYLYTNTMKSFPFTHGFSLRVIAKKVRSKKSTAFNIIKHFKQHGSVELEKPSGRRSTWDRKDVYRVNTWIKADPTITAEELMEKFHVRGVLVLFLARCTRFCTY